MNLRVEGCDFEQIQCGQLLVWIALMASFAGGQANLGHGRIGIHSALGTCLSSLHDFTFLCSGFSAWLFSDVVFMVEEVISSFENSFGHLNESGY